MAICKRCHRPVPDGVDFCDNCKVNMDTLADESYLESLLSSVMDSDSGRRSERTSKSEPEPEFMPEPEQSDVLAEDLLADIFANTDIPEELPETESVDSDDLDAIFSDAAVFFNGDITDETPVREEEPLIDDSPVFEEESLVDDTFVFDGTPDYEEEPVIDESPAFEEEALFGESAVSEEEPFIDESPLFEEEALFGESAVSEEEPFIDESPLFEEEALFGESAVSEEEPFIDESPVFEEEALFGKSAVSEEEPFIDESPVFEEEALFDESAVSEEEPFIYDAPGYDETSASEDEPMIDETPVIEESPIQEIPDIEEISLIDETPEIAALINESAGQETISADSLFGTSPDEVSFIDESPEIAFADSESFEFGDGGGTFSVDNLFGDMGIDAVPGISDISPEETSDISDILTSLDDGDIENEISGLDKDASKQAKKLPKSMFEKLFANTGTDFTPEQIEKLKLEEDEKRKADTEKKEQQKIAKAEAKTAKAEENAKRKEEKKKAAEDVKKLKKEEKAAIKEKKKQEREALESLDEYDFAQGKINKAGTLILVIFFSIVALVIVFGTDLFTYSLSIRNATVHFSKKYYNEAYYDVYGLEIKDDDVELYDRIITVMYVNKQLNSFKNFYAIEEYDKALDSLIKGLWKYNRYIELARMLGIENDLNYVRSQILTELDSKYGLSEDEAMLLMAEEGTPEYSEYIYDLVDVQYSREKELK